LNNNIFEEKVSGAIEGSEQLQKILDERDITKSRG